MHNNKIKKCCASVTQKVRSEWFCFVGWLILFIFQNVKKICEEWENRINETNCWIYLNTSLWNVYLSPSTSAFSDGDKFSLFYYYYYFLFLYSCVFVCVSWKRWTGFSLLFVSVSVSIASLEMQNYYNRSQWKWFFISRIVSLAMNSEYLTIKKCQFFLYLIRNWLWNTKWTLLLEWIYY